MARSGARRGAVYAATEAHPQYEVGEVTMRAIVLPSKRLGIIFDATRLLERRKAHSPTGIDRVDIAYACLLLNGAYANFLAVCQIKGGLRVIPEPIARSLFEELETRWSGDQ